MFFVILSQYIAEDAFIHDFEILFANARHYNEEDSQVYQDSITLEKVLRKKKRMLGAVNSGKLNTVLVKRNMDLLHVSLAEKWKKEKHVFE